MSVADGLGCTAAVLLVLALILAICSEDARYWDDRLRIGATVSLFLAVALGIAAIWTGVATS